MYTAAHLEMTWAQQASFAIAGFLRQPWPASIMRLSALEDGLALVHPMLSLVEVRAKVVQVIAETADTKTFVLRPNWQWQSRSVRAGQFVRVQVEINGRRLSRVYSLSSSPQAGLLAITVKRQGTVSNFLHDEIKLGSVLTLSQAAGEFVLPALDHAVLPDKILLLSGGSGITPVMAMLRYLQQQKYQGDVLFVHSCKSASEQIFARQLLEIASTMPNLRVHSHFSASAGRLDVARLQALVPDVAQRTTWLCGPQEWMASIHAYWDTLPTAAPLYSERFMATPRLAARPQGTPVQVRMHASGQQFHTSGAASLLQQAENAGLTPKHGCRIGICRSCQCVKRSGTVENLLTGEVSSAPDELIRLCVSVARSDLSLDL